MKTKKELLDEAASLADSIYEEKSDYGLAGFSAHESYKCSAEQRYLNWLEDVQTFIFESTEDRGKYDDFRSIKDYISPENHKKITAIINSLN